MAFLQEFEGTHPARRHPLTAERTVLGRHPECDIVLNSAAVSRQHAAVVRQGDDFLIEDLGSRNGTFVNGQLIQGQHRLGEGDHVRVCDVSLQFGSTPSTRTEAVPWELDAEASGMAMLIDDEPASRLSSVTSKVDVGSLASVVQLSVRPEVKLRALLEITQSLCRTLNLDEMLPKLLDSLFKIFIQADRGYIVMRPSGGPLIPKAVKHRRGDSEDMVRISRTIVQHVLETKKAILSADAASDERFDMSQSIVEFRVRSMMCAPMVSSTGESLGVIEVDTLDQRNRFTEEDLEVLAAVATQAAFAIENVTLHQQLMQQEKVQRDLELAQRVQQSMLPTSPPQIDGYHFFNFYRSAQEVGGDYYDYIPLPDGRLAVVVADVSGKGIPAALLMAKLSSEVRYCLASETTPAAAVRKLNAGLSRHGWQDRFITMVLAVLSPRDHSVTIVNAGHLPPLLRHGKREVCDVADETTGLPLGVLDDFEYEQHELKLEPGDFLTLFTDGISEAMNPAGDMYGLTRIREQIAVEIKSVADLGKHILEDVKNFVGDHSQSDDICLACFGRDFVAKDGAKESAAKRGRRAAAEPEPESVGS